MAMKRMLRHGAAFFALSIAPAAHAQMQSHEDADVGVRMSIPKQWTWKSRPHDVYVNCAPGKEDRGRPDCYFTIHRLKAPAEQKAITDADRQKWSEWTSGAGRVIVSKGEAKMAGFPAYHFVVRDGRGDDETGASRTFVLVPGRGVVFDVRYNAINNLSDYERYKPEVMKALETLRPTR